MIYARFECQTIRKQEHRTVFAFGTGETKEAAWIAAKERLTAQGYYVKSHSTVDEVDIDPDVHL